MKAVFYPLIFLMVAGCSSGYKTAVVKTRNVAASGTVHLPLIVDLVIDDSRVTGTYTCKSDFGVEYAKTQAVAVLLKKVSADVLIEPMYLIENTGSAFNIEVSGHPAHYKNFRTPDVKIDPATNFARANVVPPVTEKTDDKPVETVVTHSMAVVEKENDAPVKEIPAPVVTQSVTAEPAIAKDNKPVTSTEVLPVEQEKTDDVAPPKAAGNGTGAPEVVFHKVLEGETISSITKQFGITADDLNRWNDLEDGLTPGMNVVVKYSSAKKKTVANNTDAPVPKNTSINVKYHVLAAGETLYHLSQVYHVTVQQIKDWNNLTGNNVDIGRNLIVGK